MKDIFYHGIKIDGRMPLFTFDNRQAIRENRKTQTRRVINPQPKLPFQFIGRNAKYVVAYFGDNESRCVLSNAIKCPYGKPGDVRCMREPLVRIGDTACYQDNYKGYFETPVISLLTGKPLKWRWKRDYLASIHMPTEAARTVCRITDIRIERLQEISEGDAAEEGVNRIEFGPWEIEGIAMHPLTSTYKRAFQKLWDSINAKRGYGWDVPQLVWVDVFRKIDEQGE